MSAIIGFILIFFIIILTLGLVLVGGVLRFLARLKQKVTRGQAYDDQKANTTYTESQPSGRKKKVFDDDEGEYVDYIEIKDTDN